MCWHLSSNNNNNNIQMANRFLIHEPHSKSYRCISDKNHNTNRNHSKTWPSTSSTTNNNNSPSPLSNSHGSKPPSMVCAIKMWSFLLQWPQYKKKLL